MSWADLLLLTTFKLKMSFLSVVDLVSARTFYVYFTLVCHPQLICQKGQLFTRICLNFSHIKEHLKEEIEFKEEEMSDEDLQFHYFRLHDYDGNRKLDGLEIMHAISHYQNESGVTDKEETSDEANSRTVDQILDEDDLNSDGYIDYPEYIASHKTTTKNSEGHAN